MIKVHSRRALCWPGRCTKHQEWSKARITRNPASGVWFSDNSYKTCNQSLSACKKAKQHAFAEPGRRHEWGLAWTSSKNILHLNVILILMRFIAMPQSLCDWPQIWLWQRVAALTTWQFSFYTVSETPWGRETTKTIPEVSVFFKIAMNILWMLNIS